MERVRIGTIKGRHDMPVDGYILDEVKDPSDIDAIRHDVMKSMSALFNGHISIKQAWGINTAEPTTCYCSDLGLDLYVTGLTSVTAEIIAECAVNGIPLTLWHYDPQIRDYIPQVVFKE